MLKKSITIIGCGYVGRKLIPLLQQNNMSKKEKQSVAIATLVKTKQSHQECLKLGVASFFHDLDNKKEPLAEDLLQQDTLLYYFAPPPTQGVIDSRVRHFIHKMKSLTDKKLFSKIVLISTTGVYGDCQGQWVNEETPLNPQLDRAYRRCDAEQHFQAYCTAMNIPLVILRVSGIYARDKLPLQRIKAGTAIVRSEDSPFSNRIHLDDLLNICLIAGDTEDITGIFNCADGHPTTMYDYFIKIAQTHHLPIPPSITLEQAKTQLSTGMLSYMSESRRIENHKLLSTFKLSLKYPDLEAGLVAN